MFTPTLALGALTGGAGHLRSRFDKKSSDVAEEIASEDGGTIEEAPEANVSGREAFINAIAGQESGGNYNAENGDTGAYGKYQILPSNWPEWAEEAGIGADAPRTPENQEIVARFKLGQYYDKYGARGAAIAWYGGEGALNYSDEALNRKQGDNGEYPSINEYADEVLGRMGNVADSVRIDDTEENYFDESNYTDNTIPDSLNPVRGFDVSHLDKGTAQDRNSLLYGERVKKAKPAPASEEVASFNQSLDNSNAQKAPNSLFVNSPRSWDAAERIYKARAKEQAERKARAQALVPVNNAVAPQMSRMGHGELTLQNGRAQGLTDEEQAIINRYQGNPDAFNRKFKESVESVQAAVQRGDITQDVGRAYLKNLANMYDTVIGPIQNNGIIMQGQDAAIRKLVNKMRAKRKQGEVGTEPSLLQENGRVKKNAPTDMLVKTAKGWDKAEAEYVSSKKGIDITLPKGVTVDAKFVKNKKTGKKEVELRFSGEKISDKFKKKLRAHGFNWNVGRKAWVAEENVITKAVATRLTQKENEKGNTSKQVENTAEPAQDKVDNIQAKRTQAKQAIEDAPKGKTVEATTDNGVKFGVQYAIVPADSLITSNNASDFSNNEAYPQELQPRDRNRAYMRLQVEKMSGTIEPERITTGTSVNEGAPIVNKEGIVENGNGRTMALARMWRSGNKKLQKTYRDYLAKNAVKFGLLSSSLKGIDNPILVRIRTDNNVSVSEVTASTKGGAQLSTAEQALQDSKKLKDSTLAKYEQNRLGTIDNAKNAEFVRAVFKDIIPEDELNAYTTTDGSLSKSGRQRAVNAILAKAYGADPVLFNLVESTDEAYGKIGDALIAAAPTIAKLKALASNQTLFDVDLAGEILKAIKFVSNAKANNMAVFDAVSQQSMFADYNVDELTKKLTLFIDNNKGAKWKNIVDMVTVSADVIAKKGSPLQGNVFGEEVKAPTAEEVLTTAINRVTNGEATAIIRMNDEKGQIEIKFVGNVSESVKKKLAKAKFKLSLEEQMWHADRNAASMKVAKELGYEEQGGNNGSISIFDEEAQAERNAGETASTESIKNEAKQPAESNQDEVNKKAVSKNASGIDKAKVQEVLEAISDTEVFDGLAEPTNINKMIVGKSKEELYKIAIDNIKSKLGKIFTDPLSNKIYFAPGNTESIEDYALHLIAGMGKLVEDIRVQRVLGVLLSDKTIQKPWAIIRQANGRKMYLSVYRGANSMTNGLIIGVEEGQDGRVVTSMLTANKKGDKKAALREFKKHVSGADEVLYIWEGLTGHSRPSSDQQASTANASLDPSGNQSIAQPAENVKKLNLPKGTTVDVSIVGNNSNIIQVKFNGAQGEGTGGIMGRAGYKWKSDKQVWQARKTEKAMGVAEQLGYTEEAKPQERDYELEHEELWDTFATKLGIDNILSVDKANEELKGVEGLHDGAIVYYDNNNRIYHIISKESDPEMLKLGYNYDVITFDVHHMPISAGAVKTADEVIKRVTGLSKQKVEPKTKAKPSADTFSKNPDALFNTNALAGAPKQVTDIIQKMPKAEQSKTTKKQTVEKQTQEDREPAKRFDGERARKSLDALIGRKKKSEPQKNDVVPKSKFMNVFNEDELDAEIEKAKKEMSKLSANPMFNPALMKSLFKIGGIYLQKGVNKFAAWADNMVDVMGEKVRPFLPAVWDSLKKYPDNQKFNDDVMTAVMEYVGEGVDNGKSLSAIKREFADDYGDEYLGYVDAAFEGVKKYPTSDNVADVVESKQDNTKGGKENGNNEARSGSVSENQQSEPVQGAESSGETGRVSGQSDEQYERQVQQPENEPAEKRPSTRGSNGAGSVSAYSGQGENSTGAAGRGTVPLTPAQKADAKPSETPGHNYTVTKDSLGDGGVKTKYKNNVEAIKLLKQLEAEGRQATPAEQEILANYVGWGGLSPVFNINYNGEAIDSAWTKEAKELKELLTDEEYKAARASTTTAFYTPVSVIKNIYGALERLGFKGGKILEPSMGTGNFFGVMPESMRSKSSLNGVELDQLTGRIAKQLYQKANVEITGFEKAKFPDNYFDLAISNVPFGSFRLDDAKYNKYNLNIHNYFFAKAMDKVRPGGLVCFVTSTDTMQGRGDSAKLRALLKGKADLVGAIRLPDTTFKANANTEVTSDVIILQKRKDGAEPSKFTQDWLKTVPSGVKDNYNNDLAINEYFKKHPEMVLGELKSGGRYGSLIVDGKGVNIDKAMQKAIKKLPADIYEARTTNRNTNSIESAQKFLAPNNSREGTFIEKDGKVYRVQQAEMTELPKTAQKKAKEYVSLRDVAKRLLSEQINPDTTDEQLAKTRAELNKVYDKFVEQYGPINDKKNIRALSLDPDYGILEAIEDYKVDPLTNKATVSKRAIFTQRTVNPVREVTHADNVNDALALSMSQTGGVDLSYMSKLMDGKDESSILKELGDRVYENPATDGIELAEAYLSGNVREKLEIAETAAKTDERFKKNVEALKKIQPKDLEPEDISVSLGAPWIPASDIQRFTAHLLGNNFYIMDVNYIPAAGTWKVDWGKAKSLKTSVDATQTWGTKYKNVKDLLEAALNQSTPTVTHTDADGKTYTDKEETIAAQAKLRELQEEFKKWIWTDEERTNRLLAYYNRNFNNWVLRNYDGSALNFPGYSTAEPQLKQHQKDVVWRILQDGTCLMAHCVGAGKTWSMQTAAMELKRLGLANKSMFVIPNHMLQQFENEFRRIYPNAKLLTISSDTLPDVNVAGAAKMSKAKLAERKAEKNAKRQSVLGKIATEDWDGIIISHNIFKRIPMSPEAYNRFYEQQITEIEQAILDINATEGKSGNAVVKTLETTKKNLEAKLKKNVNEEAKDVVIPFEQLGVDQIFVDEADQFKNLYFTTKMRNIAGMSQANSQRSMDMFMKTQYLMNTNNGRGVVFATGTPISNTMAEMFTMLRYLDNKGLKEKNLGFFDNWAATFATKETTAELSPDGSGYRTVEKFTKFNNMPELVKMFRKVADVKKIEDLDLKIPKLKNGKPTVVEIPMNSALETYIKETAKERAAKIHNRAVDPQEDNMLKLTGDLRKASLDMRLVDPAVPASVAGGKIKAVVEHVADKYKETSDVSGVQLVFCDLSTPKGTKDKVNESDAVEEKEEAEDNSNITVYAEIKKGLIKKGIPTEQIAFIHDAKTKAQKEQLFERCRQGQVRVLIGSTEKMGAGTNIQNKLVAEHHVDAPWRPRDIEQREGRILRQGNENEEVEIFNYVTKGSFDANMWEKLKNKATMIGQAMSGNLVQRSLEDADATVLSFAEVEALASGNPLMAERVMVNAKLTQMEALAENYRLNQAKNKRVLAAIPNNIKAAEANAEKAKADIANRKDISGENFSMVIGRNKTVYTKRTDAKIELERIASHYTNELGGVVAKAGGFDIRFRAIPAGKLFMSNDGKTAYKASENTVRAEIVGEDTYFCEPTLGSIEHAIMHAPDKALEIANKIIVTGKEEMKQLESKIKEPFKYADEYEALKKRSAEIEEELKVVANPTSDVKAEIKKLFPIGDTFYHNGKSIIVERIEKNGKEYHIVTHNDENNIEEWIAPYNLTKTKDGEPVLSIEKARRLFYGNTQYSVSSEAVQRAKEEVEAEIRAAFPNGKVEYVNGVPTITMPNGSKFQYSIRENIVVNAKEQRKADAAHGTSGARVQGFWKKFTGNGVQRMLAVSQNSERGTAFHEAMHAAIDLVLTEKEKNALYNYYEKKAKEQNRDVDEVIADAYRDWVLARQRKSGTMFGKLWRKVKDFCTRIKAIFDKGAEVERIMQDIESGRVYERGTNNHSVTKRISFSKEEIQGQKGSGTTQVATTRTMYVKALKWLRNQSPEAKTVLDYGAGLGLGTDDMRSNNPDLNIDCYEPNPERWAGKQPPTYTNNTQINKDYDLILNTNVLNVVEKPIRDLIVKDIADHLTMGGKALITTRGWSNDVNAAKNFKPADEHHAIWINKGKNGYVFQKGFDGDELKNYIEELLGDEFVVEKTRPTFGKSSVTITRVKAQPNKSAKQLGLFDTDSYQEMPDSYKTLKGSVVKRSKYGVGKQMGSQVYLHKDYVSDVIPKKVWENALKVLSDADSDFEYNCVMYDTKTGNVRFDEAPDFDESREPIVGDTITVKPDGTVKRGHSNYIWHHKWLWVKNDYQGFDVNQSKAWSNKWLGTLTETADGNGIERWNTQLDRFNLEHDGEEVHYSVASPKHKIANAFTNTERKGVVDSAKDFFKEHRKSLYQDWFDKNNPLKGFDALTKATGGLSVYDQVQSLPATTAGMLKALTEGTAQHVKMANQHLKNVKMKYNVTLAMALEKIDKKQMDKAYPKYLAENGFDNWVNALGAYLGAERCLEMARLARAEGKTYKFPKGLTEQECQDFVNKAPQQFKAAADIFYKVNDNVISIMEDAEVFSHDLAKTLRTKYRKYCPLLRDFSDTAAADSFIGGLTEGGRGIGNVSVPLKRINIEGSERGVLNPLETILKSYAVMLNRAERNKVALMAVENSRTADLHELIQEVPGTTADPKNCVFTVLINGKKKAYKTTQDLYGPIVGYNLPAANLAFGVARTAARMLRTGATMSPSFILRNVLRDTVFAGIASKNGFIPVVDTIRGAIALAKDPAMRAEFEAAGVTEYNFYSSQKSRIKSLDAMAGETPASAWEIMKAVFSRLEATSDFFESSTRMGEYMKARQKGLSMEEAARAAREVTLDFSRSGRIGEQVNQVVPFFNACLQGGDKMVRLFREDFVGTSLKVLKYIVLPSLLIMAMNWDEDWYKDLDPDIKNNYWCLGRNIRIPKPQEAGVLFGSGIEALFQQAADKDKDAVSNFLKAFSSNMMPSVLPTLILPLIEWSANYSFFKGRPLVGNKYSRLPDELQYNDYTSELSKGIGSALKVSPMKIDNLVRGYTGTMGALLWSMAGEPFAKANNLPAKHFSELPFVRDFNVTDANLSRPMNEFYGILDKANRQHAGYGVKGKPEAAVKGIRSAGAMISKIRKDIDKITHSNLTPERKRELIDKRKEKMNQIAKQATARYGKYFE